MTNLESLDSLPTFIAGVRPPAYDHSLLTTERCSEVVLRNQVRFRGWYFPHARLERIAAGPKAAYVEQTTDSPGFGTHHLERWRMYRSGQFVFRALVWEYSNEELKRRGREEVEWMLHGSTLAQEPQGFLSFITLIYWVTEAYVFASRLAQSVPYASPVEVRVGYRNIDGWILTSSQLEYSLDEIYQSKRSPLSVRQVEVDRLIAFPHECAAEAIEELFQQFGWMNPSPSMIEHHQVKLVKGR